MHPALWLRLQAWRAAQLTLARLPQSPMGSEKARARSSTCGGYLVPFWIESPAFETSLPKPCAVLHPMPATARRAMANSRTTMRLVSVIIFCVWFAVAGCDLRLFFRAKLRPRIVPGYGVLPYRGLWAPPLAENGFSRELYFVFMV